MVAVMCGTVVALGLAGSRFVLWAPLPIGLALGWAWGGVAAALPMGLLALAMPASLLRWRQNRTRRRRQGDLIRALEAMLEKSYLTSNRAEVAASAGLQLNALTEAGADTPAWLARSMRQVFLDSRDVGLPLHRALTLMVEEARERVRLDADVQSQNGAMVTFVFFFLGIEVVLAGWVLLHPLEASAFRSGVGLALGLWVVISTSCILVLPWLQQETGLW